MNIQDYYSKIKDEEKRNEQLLHLTANEPFMSDTARTFMSSKLDDRYFMGGGDDDSIVDFQPFTFRGMPALQAIVGDAQSAAKEMLGAYEVNFGFLSGVHAMMCAILSTTEPGDAIMTVGLEYGGHFATQGIVERTGRKHVPTSYNFDTLSFDVEKLAQDYKAANAKAFYMDVSFYINPHNLREIRKALGEDAIIIYDASHTLGLIMGQQFQSPFTEGANVICANTHKTLPGPQKGIIAFRDKELADKASAIINSGLYSSQHTASMIALSTTVLEMKEYGKDYAKQIIANSNALGGELEKLGLKVRKANTGRYSENHQIHLFTEEFGNYRDLYKQFIKNNISVNFDNTLGGKMYIRIGTQDLTRRGMKEEEMKTIAKFLHESLVGHNISDEVEAFTKKYQKAHYSFDDSESSPI